MLDVHNRNNRDFAIVIILEGLAILVEGVFMLIVLTADTRLNVIASRLLIHHSVIFVLLALTMLKTGFFYFAVEQNQERCLATRVSRELAENTLEWNVLALAVCTAVLHCKESSLYRAFNTCCVQFAVMASEWVVSGAIVAGIYAWPGSFWFHDDTCGHLSYRSMIVRVVFTCTLYGMLLSLVLTDLLQGQFCRRLTPRVTSSDLFKSSAHAHAVSHTKHTLSLFLRAGCVALLPFMAGEVHHLAKLNLGPQGNAADDSPALYMVLALLGFLWHIALFPLLLCRHPKLRQHFKEIVLRKCFVYDEGFSETVDRQHELRQTISRMMQDPTFRQSTQMKRESLEMKQDRAEEKPPASVFLPEEPTPLPTIIELPEGSRPSFDLSGNDLKVGESLIS